MLENMLKIPGYETLERIHEGKNTLIYRARREKDRRPVIFKTTSNSYPSPAEIGRLKREYEITTRFPEGGVIQTLELISARNSPVLILEDIGANALINFLKQGPLELEDFLSLAVRLGNILGEIHAKNIIHKDVNPANMLWNRERDTVKIIDFGISLELSREVTGIKNPNLLEGTLPYISPEQTGRMNRFLDYRTDYYSLGVTFYQMLAGRLPFESMDAMELVYAHIAREAPALHELDTNIPRVVSDIIQKLMAKNVEDRYQSASGLIHDLEICRREWFEAGGIKPFAVGRADVSHRFQIPQNLYGRDDEIAALLGAFERASRGHSELMLVSGLPGIGKSALVNEIQKPIVKMRGNFIAGKYDKFKKDVPYSALLQAFSGLVKHLLAENEDELADWRRKILEALGPNGRVVTEVLPELELVIGKQADIPDLGPEESRNRFNLYFQFFMGVFCRPEHPLVLFLDDLQWADHASLDMMKLFLSDPEINNLLVIGAFRSSGPDSILALNLVLDDIRNSGTGVSSIFVNPLDISSTKGFLSESLHCDPEETAALAELLLRKTGGNPFFLGEFLKTLYQDQMLELDGNSRWSWDLNKITTIQVTDNVVQLMSAKIEGLPGAAGDLLKLGACFGNFFTLENLREISGNTELDILGSLNILLEASLLVKLENNFHFSHDRIQEAAYVLIPEDERIKIHHRIGRLELEKSQGESLSRRVFYIVNHLNAARSLIRSESDKLELARLNHLAGVRARASAAYRPAANFLDIALGLLELLEGEPWKTSYELSLGIHQEATYATYLCGEYERMELLADTVILYAHDVLDTVNVYEAKIFSFVARNESLQAILVGLLILRKLGLRLPLNPGKLHVVFGLLSVKWALLGKSIKQLEELPEIKDTRLLAIMRILSGMGSSAYIALPTLLPLIIFAFLKLSVKHGNSMYSPYSFGGYGFVTAGVLGDLKTGYKFGHLALRLLERLKLKEGRARTLYIVHGLVRGWKKHLRNSLTPMRVAFKSAMETGDPEFVGNAATGYIMNSFYCGCNLVELEKECIGFQGLVVKHKQLFALNEVSKLQQLFLNLQGHAEDPRILKGEAYNYETNIKQEVTANEQISIYTTHFFNCFLNLLFGEHENALNHLALAEEKRKRLMTLFFLSLVNFYKSLAQLGLYSRVEKSRRRKFMRAVIGNQKQMKRWAKHAPMNFKHKFHLVEAEKARVLGRALKARKHYEKAIRGARDNQYLHEEAMALELFGKFWLEEDNEEIAAVYLNKARQAFASWGATAKVRHLEDTYPQFMYTISYEQRGSDDILSTTGNDQEHSTTGRAPSGRLDLATVMKGSQAISGEIVLGNLLRKMIKIVMENAGARRGYLILEYHRALFIEAAGDLESEEFTVLQSQPLRECQGVSVAIIQYAARTKEIVVLNDAVNEGLFTRDVYITAHKPKSVLCVPVLNQGKLSAILYLENNLSVGAFTADRLEILNILSSQIAVSIENARLYGNLEGKVQERTAELRDTLVEIQNLKNKQDGDYFLTSLLLNPLARNEVKSERVKVEFLLEQKKQFKFDKWEDELGGDICIAHSVTLENTSHTIFLNADAMGKSMQGAGGALVLGAVFQSIIERTRLTSFDEAQSAAAWLEGTFGELQKVFESFEGSMLISIVLGSLCEQTGVLQLINAEHPWTVLFRNGEASFLEKGISLYKLGAQEQFDSVYIYKTELISGDVLIAGSDGRDDILLPVAEDDGDASVRNINSDETLFLQRVEEGGGELAGIRAGLLRQGELTDDLSLLRLEYLVTR